MGKIKVAAWSMGFVLLVGSPIVSAIGFSEVAVAEVMAVDQRKVEADQLLERGNQQFVVSQFDAALQSWQNALKLYRELKDQLGESGALGGLGIAYYSLGNYPKAIEFQEQSLAIAREIKNRLREGKSLGSLGLAYYSLGNYPKAIEFHQQSLAIARELKDRLVEGQSLGNLGNAYYSLGNYPKAIEFHQQRLAIAREIKDRLGEGQSLGGLGIAYYALGNYPKAIDYYQQAVAVIETTRQENRKLTPALQASYTKTVTYAYQNLANLLITQGRAAEAQKVLDLLKR